MLATGSFLVYLEKNQNALGNKLSFSAMLKILHAYVVSLPTACDSKFNQRCE